MRLILLYVILTQSCDLRAQQTALGTKTLPPPVMHWCSLHCSAWVLDYGDPFDKPHYGTRKNGSVVIVERFSPEEVVMQRTDYGSVPGKATLRGRLSSDGNSIVGGTIEWTWHPCCGPSTGRYEAAWGAAMNSIPGQDGPEQAALTRRLQPNQQISIPAQNVPLAQSQTVDLAALPKVMHFCALHCMTLVWDRDHFTTPHTGSVWAVESFMRKSVVIRRVDAGPNPYRAVYRARISDSGEIVDGGNYRFTWGTKLNSIPGEDGPEQVALTNELQPKAQPDQSSSAPLNLSEWAAQLMADSKAELRRQGADTSRVKLPPGASPQFATFPADMRAVLQPDVPILPAKMKLACTAAVDESDPDEALEIGKFAFRAAEFDRGYCWIRRSAALESVRANVILGVAYIMGWGVQKDAAKGFQYFKTESHTTPDVWAGYFAKECYLHGVGTPVNLPMATRIETNLMFSPAGQAMYMSIGADDREVRRQYERGLALFSPPITTRSACEYSAAQKREICHNDQRIDQERLGQDLKAIDAKYKH